MRVRNTNTYKIIKGILAIILIVYIIFLFVGGGFSDANFDDVKNSVLNSTDLSNMQEAEPRMIKRLYGLSAADYEGMALYYPTTNMGADEIFLAKLSDDAQHDEVIAAINARLDKQKKSFDGYGVEQTKLLNESIIDDRGNYILFVVSASADLIDVTFKNSLKGKTE